MKKAYGFVIALCVLLATALLIILTTIIVAVCLKEISDRNRPSNQGISQWMSEDGNIFFKTNEHGYAYGYIQIDDEVIPVQLTFGFGSTININGYTSTGCTIMQEYDKWEGSYYNKNSFTAEVIDSVFFKSGEKIKFCKLEDEEQIDYEPLSFYSKEDDINYENTIDRNADLLIPVINEFISGNDVQYEAHMIALRMNFSGIKEITDAEIISIENDLMNLYAADTEENEYSVVYSLSASKVYYVYENSSDGRIIYSIDNDDWN